MKPVLLALTFLSEEHRAQMAEVFEVVYPMQRRLRPRLLNTARACG